MNTSLEAEMATPIAPVTPRDTVWGAASRVAFRFVFAFFLLSTVPFPFSDRPWTEKLNAFLWSLVDPLMLWVAVNILGIDGPINTQFNGSGDRTYDYVKLFAFLMLAVAVTATWSVIDRHRKHYTWLLEALRLYVRVVVGTAMLSYGFAKVFSGGQFVAPDAVQLLKPYGESSPMNLLWTFMGASQPYTFFAGLMEVVPGTMLLIRRTASLGAVLLLGVIGNIVLLNFCYDVPVKLYSSQLWLMSVFLAAPAIHRIVSVLVLNEPVPPERPWRFFASRRAHRIGVGIFAAILGGLVLQATYPNWEIHLEYEKGDHAPVGYVFDVEDMTINGQISPESDLDPLRWKRVWVRRWGLRLFWVTGKNAYYRSKSLIEEPMTLDLSHWDDTSNTRCALLELRQEGDHYVVEGEFEGAKVRARLKAVDASNSLLMTRGFHWINEFPFNR